MVQDHSLLFSTISSGDGRRVKQKTPGFLRGLPVLIQGNDQNGSSYLSPNS